MFFIGKVVVPGLPVPINPLVQPVLRKVPSKVSEAKIVEDFV